MTTQTLTLDQCPASVQAYFLAMPAFQNAMRITKSATTGTDKTQAVKTLKTSRIIPREEMVLKAANTGGFASILSGSVARNIGTPAPAIPKTPAPTTAPTDAVLARANAGGAGITRQASNTPKTPIPSKGEPVSFQDLRSAIDTALAERHQREQAERFNSGRSAFSRLAPARESDAPRGGVGDAWSLRNFGGKQASAVLNGTTRKAESTLPTNTGFRAVSGTSLK
ncbi:MAG: hypothetical protein I8H67_11010 [Comamonadaceae bacterium]|nr:hypothetical protein [Comamonadaceae bacterium]